MAEKYSIDNEHETANGESSDAKSSKAAVFYDEPSEQSDSITKSRSLVEEASLDYDNFDVEEFLKNLSPFPGVYRFIDANDTILYVGKAKNLKKRVTSYFRSASTLTEKHINLKAAMHRLEVTLTNSEAEALVLENQLIKQNKPKYNVLLRDDKSYPFVLVTDEAFPRVSFYRGRRRDQGNYFGPFPSVPAVRDTLAILHRVFKLRQCEDSVFKHRSRPCLQFQIKRCSGSCCGEISAENYRKDVEHAKWFLRGKSDLVIRAITEKMEAASMALDFELAAEYRDQIQHLRTVQMRQYVDAGKGNIDVISAEVQSGTACVQVLFIRDGMLLGNRAFYPKLPAEDSVNELIGQFISQFYADKNIPEEIIVSDPIEESAALSELLSELSEHSVKIKHQVRGERSRWVGMASKNAKAALKAHLDSKAWLSSKFEALESALELDFTIERAECFDISHTMGEATVASCIVYNREGPVKNDYRRYNIEDITPGDDYAAMAQAITRRYGKTVDEKKLPDVLFIDGGKGQLNQAVNVLSQLQVQGITLIGVSKGPDRHSGWEKLHVYGEDKERLLPEDSNALQLVIQIRDEAHRFAITGHRARREKARKHSVLQNIPGVGAKRRQALIKHFGGAAQVSRASVEDISQVNGISSGLAQEIYDHLHN